MPDYTITRYRTSQLRGQGGVRNATTMSGAGTIVGTVAAVNSEEALTDFLSEGGVEGRHIELTVVKDPRGQDEAWVEVAYQLYVAQRSAPKLIAEDPPADNPQSGGLAGE